MDYLYDALIKEFGKRGLESTEVPQVITDNLKYAIRPYQKEAFQRYVLCSENGFPGKPDKPLHLLYNMATGSGKTLVMAGLILHLYTQGYRRFLFFVNSKNIINKTKDNFLNSQATKYLFRDQIIVDGKAVLLKEVASFDEVDLESINIKFTTIQQLHLDINKTKEGSVTLEDFEHEKTVLIADEAHHLQAATKQGDLLRASWENTAAQVLNASLDNILLEFTATLDYENPDIVAQYQNKVIQKYDLAQFRLDQYSKEINLLRSEYAEQERIIQALILNLYRQELASANGINLKPVILFKAKRTIAESAQNQVKFHQLIDDLSAQMIGNIKATSTIPIVQCAFRFFTKKDLSLSNIAERLQFHFKAENCISANDDKEAELNQIRLNTLEDADNPLRAVFAVQKLNEGWDVLNLFDIVRLYEGQNTGGSNKKIGKTTLAEAQLIGRGARYSPFTLVAGQDSYTRKYDDDLGNDLRVLEELYYHTKEDNRYIAELKKALVASGIYEDEDDLETKQLTLKPSFKKTNFYKQGRVFFNKKIVKNYAQITSFADLGVVKRNIEFPLASGTGQVSSAFAVEGQDKNTDTTERRDIRVANIPSHIIRYALSQTPFFYFDSLVRYFPQLASLSNFIKNEAYLGGLEITFKGTESRIDAITDIDFYHATNALLEYIAVEIKDNLVEYEGSDYINEKIFKVFKDKAIQVKRGSERADGQQELVANKPWYVYNANYGTSEEKAFVKMFARRFRHLKQNFDNIYLVRNEREIKIIDQLGRAFEPDFLLFCKPKIEDELTYQIFIEPKGKQLWGVDQWKQEFLELMRQEPKTITIKMDKYRITGVPFYNKEDENEFKTALESVLQ